MPLPFKNETEVKQWLDRGLKEVDPFAQIFNIVGSSMQRPGWPDKFVALRGCETKPHSEHDSEYLQGWPLHGFIELKFGNNELSTAQLIQIRKLVMCGVNVWVIVGEKNGTVWAKKIKFQRVWKDNRWVKGEHTVEKIFYKSPPSATAFALEQERDAATRDALLSFLNDARCRHQDFIEGAEFNESTEESVEN